MKDEDVVPAGSEPINPLMDNQAPEQPAEASTEAAAPATDKPEASDDAMSRLEKMFKDSQSMIGKQSSEIGSLRAKLDEMTRQPEAPAGPSDDETLNDLLAKMDNGEITIEQGMREALAINSKLIAVQVMNQLNQRDEQEKVAEVQGKFLKDNPDYEEVLQNGALQPYLDADPMADEYTAYHKYKGDERVNAIKAEYDAKVLAAKEEGAKLAKGAESAGKVLGKQGGSAQAPQVNRPFKNNQEATAAMMSKLHAMRSSSQ